MLVGASAAISLVVPVGPRDRHREFLPEFIRSVEHQTVQPSEVVFIDDGGGCIAGTSKLGNYVVGTASTRIVRNRWNLGVPASMNVGVGSAYQDLVLMACADDMLLPRCIELCWESWLEHREALGYYYLGVRYPNGEEQNTPCGAAMVTKDLWRYTGGFHPACAVGAADHIFLSAMLGASKRDQNRAKILRVSDDVLYWYRLDSNGATSGNIWPAIEGVKERLTTEWVPPGEHELTG